MRTHHFLKTFLPRIHSLYLMVRKQDKPMKGNEELRSCRTSEPTRRKRGACAGQGSGWESFYTRGRQARQPGQRRPPVTANTEGSARGREP